MELSGQQIIGNTLSQSSASTFHATNAATGGSLTPPFSVASADEINQAVALAEAAFPLYQKTGNEARGAFLNAIAEEIEALGDPLIQRAVEESGLPQARIAGERGRTTEQLRLFAKVVQEGSYVEARIDTALPHRQPLPRPDIRLMNVGLGPVAVFGASNFPLAFSVAGGDTVSALAAGCPVVVKAHFAHPGTSAFVALAIQKASRRCQMPEGTFSMLHGGADLSVGEALVKHPSIKAVGFTGSYRGGRALYNLAVSRPEPIPCYAEMGSINPVFILPGALKDKALLAKILSDSIVLGVGQFCTNPGLMVTMASSDSSAFIAATGNQIAEVAPGVMLHAGIHKTFETGVAQLKNSHNVHLVKEGAVAENRATATLLQTDAITFLNADLQHEVFGPVSLIVEAESKAQYLAMAKGLHGHLTATIYGTEEELGDYQDLIEVLEKKVGRLIFNGVPTGVEVCEAMTHGGPYPATTDSRTTSVGTGAIKRFLRPLTYQNYPQCHLPEALKNDNPQKIWRLINGELSKDAV